MSHHQPGLTADGAAQPWTRLKRKMQGSPAWKPRPRRLQLTIEPKQVVACPEPFVTVAVDAPPALLLGGLPGSQQEAVLTSATAATSISGVATWTNGCLVLTVTLHRSGVFADDPFEPAACALELRTPVARGYLLGKQLDSNGASSPPAVARVKPLCVYGLDLADHCDPRNDVIQREHTLHPESGDSRATALTVLISSRHCEEIPVEELQRYREQARTDQAASALTDSLTSALDSTYNKLLAAQDAEAQARQEAARHSADLEDMEEQLKVAEAEREELDAEHAILRALAKLPAGPSEPAESSRVLVEPENFLVLQRDLVHTRRALQRMGPQLEESRTRLRQLSTSSSDELPRMLQLKIDALQRENDDLWTQALDAGDEASLRQHILLLESDLQASDVELESMEGHLRKMKEERDEAVSYVGRDLLGEVDQLRERVEEQQRAASEAATAAAAREEAFAQLSEARERADSLASSLRQELKEAQQTAVSLEKTKLEVQEHAQRQREQELAAVRTYTFASFCQDFSQSEEAFSAW